MQVPLLRMDFGDGERAALEAVLASGMLVQGPRVEAFENVVRERTGRAHAIAVTNGTAALDLALEAIGIGTGDDVLCPNLTWPSPAHAIARRGANAVLVDVHPTEWNAQPEAFAAARTPRTRAAIAIDQFGFPARSPEISAALEGVTLIEDAACAIGSTLGGKPAGSFGVISCLSFHPRKVVTTGEGGMCLTDDAALADRLRVLRNHGQRTPGEFVAAGGNQRMPEMAAALGAVQMGKLDRMIAARAAQAARYRTALPELGWQTLADGATTNFQTIGAVLSKEQGKGGRDRLLAGLKERGVGANILSYALHRLPAFASANAAATASGRTFFVSETIVDRGFALPCYPSMTEEQQAYVIAALREILG